MTARALTAANHDARATLDGILARQMAFVTGKGGVGKSTVAAALALAATARGRRATGCALNAIDMDAALTEWMTRNVGHVGAGLLSRSNAFHYFVAAAPGARELISIGKAWDLTRDGGCGDESLVVVDGPSTGHAIAVLQAPKTFAALGGIGRVGRQARRIGEFLADPTRCAIVLVCTPSEMPVTETSELAAAVEGVTARPPDIVIANQVLPDRFDDEEAARIENALTTTTDPWLRAAARQARVSWRRAREQAHELDRLRTGLAIPVVELPFLFVPALGPGELRALAGALTPSIAD
jgi:anion-transporting  ArsA/GET3 family ATPase